MLFTFAYYSTTELDNLKDYKRFVIQRISAFIPIGARTIYMVGRPLEHLLAIPVDRYKNKYKYARTVEDLAVWELTVVLFAVLILLAGVISNRKAS